MRFGKAKKALHAGNIAGALALATQAVEITVTGGTVTAITVALSGLELWPSTDKAAQQLAEELATRMKARIEAETTNADRRRIVAQLLTRFPASEDDIATGHRDPATIAARLRKLALETTADPEQRDPDALDLFETATRAAIDHALAQLRSQNPQGEADTKHTHDQLAILVEQARSTGKVDKLREEGITEKAIIRLAQRIASETEDLGQAWLELQNAMDIAVDVQRRGNAPSNHGDFVDEVLRRAAALSAQGEHAEAGDEIAAALDEAEAEHRARMGRLIETGVEVALLEGNEEKAAALLIRQADLDAGGRADVAALRALIVQHYEEGRDKGLAQPLELAIALSRTALPRCTSADERGNVRNDLGVALHTLGQRESGTDRLEQSVAAYRAALEEWIRDRVPLDWAGAQMNLGNTLLALGQRESGTERLEQAVAAYRAALEECTRDRAPLYWAKAQMNLGNALRVLGERESGTARLEQAVAAFRAALEEYPRDRVPLDWATAQMNLGNALATLGQRESGTARLEQAVASYRAALEERTRNRVPLAWAMTQMNLGNALQTLGQRESDTDRLEQAVAAYRAALEEWTLDRVPLDWAAVQMNLGRALQTLGQRETGTERLEQATAAYRAALEEWTRDRVPLDWAMVQGNLANCEMAFFEKTGDPTHLATARGHVESALEVFSAAGASQYVWMSERQLEQIAALEAG
ncbi:tetratricopeptide repeat protein [Vannielia litorea]|uniref:tetratricopeptide repeat protein n=1 Tax=Vannielia litorea TaxID=1217970 RepID=UPI001BCCE002|nr:tetratricopeptide repeat protein [Vannielia litorea]